MNFQPIDPQCWERRELFDYFRNTVVTATVELDITQFLPRIKGAGIRFYPAVIHCIAAVINGNECFRHGFDEDGQVGIWQRVDPMYTVPRKHRPDLFSMGLTAYEDDFSVFYRQFLRDEAQAAECGRLFCRHMPPHLFGVTATPALRFSAMGFGGGDNKTDLTPFAIIGRYATVDGCVKVPIVGELAHSVNDGYHISLFYSALQQALDRMAAGGFA